MEAAGPRVRGRGVGGGRVRACRRDVGAMDASGAGGCGDGRGRWRRRRPDRAGDAADHRFARGRRPRSAPVFLMATCRRCRWCPPAALAAMPADQAVERRVVELEAAAMLDELRGRHRHRRLGPGARRLAGRRPVRFAANEWTQARSSPRCASWSPSATAQRSMKEARYSGSRMANRLVVAGEETCPWRGGSLLFYLRRKGGAG